MSLMLGHRSIRSTVGFAVAAVAVAACAQEQDADLAPREEPVPIAAPVTHSTQLPAPAVLHDVRSPINGRSFPDGVLALTWDDGPDQNTLKLAEFLEEQRVSATFFVVGEWTDDLSSDPGWGHSIFESGHVFLPILGELVALGHRIANHTFHHVLLDRVGPAVVRRELAENQAQINPFLEDEVEFFRPPGGFWNAASSRAIANDPRLSNLVGPVAWDVDERDWESAVYDLHKSAHDREPGPRGVRVKPSATARAYLDAIVRKRRGVVLLHDRVGDVGSTYALRVAQELVPALIARGFVFAAPLLHFSPLTVRMSQHEWGAVEIASLVMADLDRDGRADACARGAHGVTCALTHVAADGIRPPRVVMRPMSPGADPSALTRASGASASDVAFGDLNGDGRPDRCARDGTRIMCALASSRGFLAATAWLEAVTAPFALADVSADGRADLCTFVREGLACALAP